MKNPLRWLAPARTNAPADTKQADMTSLFAISNGGQARWSSPAYANLVAKGYMANPVVHRCVRLIAETAAAMPLLAYDGDQEMDEHPALQLLRRPHAGCGGRAFVESLIGHLLVSGNAYVEMVVLDDEPRELHLLRPDRVTPVTGRSGWIEAYDYDSGSNGQKSRYAPDGQGRLPLLHLRTFHPLDDLQGFAPLQAALMALDIHTSASRWNKALLDNSARPSGALVYAAKEGGNLTEEQFDRLKSELEDGYSGAQRAGRPLLLEGGLDWKAMGFSPRDMDFMEARNGAARDIALAFGVPPMLLGIPGDNTYANYAEANRAFVRQTLLPLIGRMLDSFSEWLGEWSGSDLRLAVDEDRIEGLSAEREAVWSRLAAADFLSDDEKRVALGYSPRGAEGSNDD